MSNIADTITPSLLNSSIVLPIINNTNNKFCQQGSSTFTCYFNVIIHISAYILLAFSLLPQIIHLFNHGIRYIAGISYIWIIIRVLSFILLITDDTIKWSRWFQLIAFISIIHIFIQILLFSPNLHRQNKIILIVISLSIWIIGGSMVFFLPKQRKLLLTTGYILLVIHMLPQILLNSLLRTAKALSKFSIISLAISDIFLFYIFSLYNSPIIYLITTYYSLSFFLLIYLQSIVYTDEHIHLVSRSAHTVLTPGVDIFTGLDMNGTQSSGQEPQMFSIEELESLDGVDIVYQPVTTNKPARPIMEQTLLKRFAWYATLGLMVSIEIIFITILIYRSMSLWIILVPLSIPAILGIFYLLRTKLSVSQAENLRKIL